MVLLPQSSKSSSSVLSSIEATAAVVPAIVLVVAIVVIIEAASAPATSVAAAAAAAGVTSERKLLVLQLLLLPPLSKSSSSSWLSSKEAEPETEPAPVAGAAVTFATADPVVDVASSSSSLSPSSTKHEIYAPQNRGGTPLRHRGLAPSLNVFCGPGSPAAKGSSKGP